MKAVLFRELGGPEVLEHVDVDDPVPGSGQVRVRVAASAFNPADSMLRAGFMPIPLPLPHVPGYDVSGIIDAVGDGVDGLAVGDAVYGFLPIAENGGAAEYVVAPADAVVHAPASIPLSDAAAIPSVALTAWQALFDEGRLEAGQRVLIVGAGGVVGKYAIQLAKRAGASVIATASPRSAEAVRAAGADEVIDHTESDILSSVQGRVDLLINLAPITPDQFSALVALVTDGGAVVSATAWMPAQGDPARGVRSSLVFAASSRDRLAELASLVDNGELRVEVSRRIPLAQLPDLHAEAATAPVFGKVIVIP